MRFVIHFLIVVFLFSLVSSAEAGAAAPACKGPDPIVLGSDGPPLAPHGFGECMPTDLSNGGNGSSAIASITWTSWGGRAAFGTGRTAFPVPTRDGHWAGNFGAVVRIKAYGIGRCSPGGPRAYLYVAIRAPWKPGGPLGPWHDWFGSSKPPSSTACGKW